MAIPNSFRLFTKESLAKNQRCAAETKLQRDLEKQKQKEAKEDDDEENKPQPNPTLEAGKPLPKNFGNFPPELYGKPIEDLDEYYASENVS